MTRSDTPSDQDILSAMMDGEWRADDVRGALVDVCRDDARRARWGRYHLARDAMHAEAIDVRGSVAASVSAAIAAEPTYSNVSAIGGAAERTVVDTDEAGTTDKADMTDVTDQAVAAQAGTTEPAARMVLIPTGLQALREPVIRHPLTKKKKTIRKLLFIS